VSKLLSGVAAAALLVGSVHSASAQGVEIIFAVDESGSMGGEQDFLSTFVPQLAADIASAGGGTSQFGLVGYGSASVAPRQIDVGGGQFGTADEFATAVDDLLINGGTEDGYAAYQFSVDNYEFAGGSQRVVVVVTDEDRDNTDASITFASLTTLFEDNNVTPAGIISQSVTDPDGVPAVGASSDETFIDANDDGEFEVSGPPVLGAAAGTTTADYTDLILQFPDGCFGDLNTLRDGGNAAEAFASAFAQCLVDIVVTSSISPFVSTASRDATIGVVQNFNDMMALRMTGRVRGPSTDAMQASAGNGDAVETSQMMGLFPLVQYAAAMTDSDAFGTGTQSAFAPFNGGMEFGQGQLRGFASVQGTIGNFDYGSVGGNYDTYTVSGLVGVDYEVMPNTLVGIAGGLTGTWSNEVSTDSEVSGYGFTVGLYGSLPVVEQGYLDGFVSYARTSLDTERDTGGGGKASADGVTGQAASIRLEGGYVVDVPDIVTLIPALEAQYTYLDIDSFAESGPGAASFSAQEYNLFSLTPKVSFTDQFEGSSFTLVPQATLGADINLGDRSDTVTASSIESGATLTSFSTPNVYRAAAVAQVGVAAVFDDAFAVRLDYTGTFSRVSSNNAITGRVRIPF